MKLTHPKILVASILVIFLIGFTTAFNFGVEFENNGTGNIYNYYNITNGTSYWNKTGTDIWTITNNIGIGTDSPTSNLQVEGKTQLIAEDNYQYFEITPSIFDLISLTHIGLGDVYEENTGTNLRIHVNEEKFIFDYGNVGIYNHHPTHALDVTGSGHFTENTSSDTDFCITNGNCLSNMGLGNSLWNNVSGIIQTNSPVQLGDYITPYSTEQFSFNYGDDDGHIIYRNSGYHEMVQTWYNEEDGIIGEFNIDTTPGVYQFEIKATDEKYNLVFGAGGYTNMMNFNGSSQNIGIGGSITNPSEQLEIEKNLKINGKIIQTNSTNTFTQYLNINGTLIWEFD